MGIPRSLAGWFIYFMVNPNLKWMMTGGNIIFLRKPPDGPFIADLAMKMVMF